MKRILFAIFVLPLVAFGNVHLVQDNSDPAMQHLVFDNGDCFKHLHVYQSGVNQHYQNSESCECYGFSTYFFPVENNFPYWQDCSGNFWQVTSNLTIVSSVPVTNYMANLIWTNNSPAPQFLQVVVSNANGTITTNGVYLGAGDSYVFSNFTSSPFTYSADRVDYVWNGDSFVPGVTNAIPPTAAGQIVTTIAGTTGSGSQSTGSFNSPIPQGNIGQSNAIIGAVAASAQTEANAAAYLGKKLDEIKAELKSELTVDSPTSGNIGTNGVGDLGGSINGTTTASGIMDGLGAGTEHFSFTLPLASFTVDGVEAMSDVTISTDDAKFTSVIPLFRLFLLFLIMVGFAIINLKIFSKYAGF